MDALICYSCFQPLESAEVKFCPHCGRPIPQDWDKHPAALPYGTVLAGRYITGRVLGQGGFGITYLAQDHQTGGVVAVKEFFPDTMASRGEGHSIIPYTGQRGDDFVYGRKMFLEEAKTMAELRDVPGIVHVFSYFEEYGTAYFAMEYVDHINFQNYIEQHGGRIDVADAKRILIPAMETMAQVHAKGIIHRDIKPDNIYLNSAGQVKILDFGSARYSMGERSRSLDVILTHGFAPREQYSRHGRQGAYTDVYALAATFYYAITGRKPPDSIDRIDEDALALPSSLGAKISPAEEEVLLHALAVEPQDRYPTMDAFRQALLNPPPVRPAPAPPSNGPTNFTTFPSPDPAPPRDQSPGNSSFVNPNYQPVQPVVERNANAPQPGPSQNYNSPPAQQPEKKKKLWLIPAGIAAAAVVALVLVLTLPKQGGTGTQEQEQNGITKIADAPVSDAPVAATLAPVSSGGQGSAPSGGGAVQVFDPSGGKPSQASATPVAGYYLLTMLAGNGMTFDATSDAAKEMGFYGAYIQLRDEHSGTFHAEDVEEEIELSNGTLRLEGVDCRYTLENGVLTLNLEIPGDGTPVTMTFTRKGDAPPAGAPSGGGETTAVSAAKSGKCGDNVTWTLDDDTLTISGTGPMYDCSHTTDIPWYDSNAAINFVVVKEGVTRIGEGAFYECEMVDVELPESLETIGANAFLECPWLFDITIPAGVRGIGTDAFAGCERLEWARINCVTANLYATCFENCAAMTEVTFAGDAGTIAADAFNGCTAAVNIPARRSWNAWIGKDLGGKLKWVREDVGEIDAARLYADKYSVAIPANWQTELMADVRGDSMNFYHRASAEYGSGGFLFSISLFQKYDDYAAYPSYEVLGNLTDGTTYYTVVELLPSDVQFPAAYQESYMFLLNNLWYVTQYLGGENGFMFVPKN